MRRYMWAVPTLLINIIVVVCITLCVRYYNTEYKTATPAHACWTEPKTDNPPERICGDVTKAPSNSINWSDRP